MATQVQWRGGSTAEHSTFTGAAREVTVDTQKKTLVVHDGSTAGGEPLLREDQANLPTSVTNGISVPSTNNVAISTNGAERARITADGRLGVGTNNPLAPFVVSDGGAAGLEVQPTGFASAPSLVGYNRSTSSYASVTLDGAANIFAISGTEKARITSDGKLGLGTSSPSTNLHVVGASDSGSIQIGNSADSQYHYINFGGSSSSHNAWQVGRSPSGGIGPANGFYIYDLKNSATRLAIDSSGNVGIGTTAPSSQFVVSNGGGVGLEVQPTGFASAPAILSYNRSGAAYTQLTIDGSSNVFAISGAERARIDSSGRLLVGTSSATNSAPLQVLASNNGAWAVQLRMRDNANDFCYVGFSDKTGSESIANIWSDRTAASTGSLVFETNNGSASPTERMRIDSAGTVTIKGVSTSLPIARFSGISGGDGNYSVDIKQPTTAKIDFVQRWFTSGQNEATVFSLGSGNFFSVPMYSSVVGGTNRDVYIDNNGLLGYVSSIRSSKDNIAEISDVSWLQLLNPVSFNRRQLNENKEYTDELYSELEYGLIAEEVEQVAPELCFYDDVDGEQELRGVHYNKLIAPMLKALQQANTRIETLEAEVAALKGA